MLFGNELPSGIEAYSPVFSGKIMDVLLESVQDLFFSGVAERMAVCGLCIDLV